MERMDAKRAVLKVENLRKSFYLRKKEFPVLKGVDLELRRGEVVLITGKSGVGKSTLISMLGGLEPPTAGDIFWGGMKLGKNGSKDWAQLRKEKIGIIFQDYNLITSWTAIENVEAPLMFTEKSERERRKSAMDIMGRLGIADLAENKPAELSEGQQQRVAVARTLIMNPELILADEPTGGVDPDTGKVVTQSLLSLVKENGASMLVATHGGNSLPEIADRNFRLEDGTLINY